MSIFPRQCPLVKEAKANEGILQKEIGHLISCVSNARYKAKESMRRVIIFLKNVKKTDSHLPQNSVYCLWLVFPLYQKR